MRHFLRLGGLFVFSLTMAVPAHATAIVYTTDASFLTAAGGGLTFEGFESAVAGPTSLAFSGGTFTCQGSSWCPGFFGVSAIFSDTGSQSVYYATPDSATFSFSDPITKFGLAIGGAGDVAPITLTALLSNGHIVNALTNYSGPFTVFGTNRQYFGVIDSVPFSTVKFTGSNANDGIFFDTMNYGGQAAVPEPASLLLLGTGLAGLRRWRKRRQEAA